MGFLCFWGDFWVILGLTFWSFGDFLFFLGFFLANPRNGVLVFLGFPWISLVFPGLPWFSCFSLVFLDFYWFSSFGLLGFSRISLVFLDFRGIWWTFLVCFSVVVFYCCDHLDQLFILSWCFR